MKDGGQIQLWFAKLQTPWFAQEKFPQLLNPHKGPLPGMGRGSSTERAMSDKPTKLIELPQLAT